MKFSVIVPIYNVEKYILACVESILSQTFRDFELILVDDGSPDACPMICDKLEEKDSRVKAIHKPNGGLSDARNKGIEAACGDYLIFIDGDDYLANDHVFETVAKEIERTHPDIVQYHCMLYYEKDNQFIQRAEIDSSKYAGLSSADMINALVKDKMVHVSACMNVISLDFVNTHKLFFKKGIKGEDIDWAFRVLANVPVISVLPDFFYVYRAGREGSITSSMEHKNMLDYCEILEHAVELIENSDKRIRDALMSYCMYHILICAAHNERIECSGLERKYIRKRLKALCRGRIKRYTVDSRVKMAARVYNLFGFTIMAKLLGVYLSKRGRKHSYRTVEV